MCAAATSRTSFTIQLPLNSLLASDSRMPFMKPTETPPACCSLMMGPCGTSYHSTVAGNTPPVQRYISKSHVHAVPPACCSLIMGPCRYSTAARVQTHADADIGSDCQFNAAVCANHFIISR
jgi:hypothetical protein